MTGDAPFANGSATAGGDASAGGDAGAVVRAPDISSLSPSERADRLFDRVMRLKEQGKQDSVEFFAPMVMSAYQMMGPLNADQHYDLGRIGEVTGVTDLARAEADTILKANPAHLLGLALAAHAATAANHTVAVPLTASVSTNVILLAVVLAVAGGLIAGMFGGWRAARLRPADALGKVA